MQVVQTVSALHPLLKSFDSIFSVQKCLSFLFYQKLTTRELESTEVTNGQRIVNLKKSLRTGGC